MKDLWQLKREFLEYGEIEKGQSLLTIENYDRYLTRFLTWLENERNKIQETNPKQIPNLNDQITKTVIPDLIGDPLIVDSRLRGNDNTDPLPATSYKLTPDLITQEIVRKYRLYINRLTARDGKELKGATQNHHSLAVRAFLRYLSMRGEASLAPEKVTLAKASDREVTFLNMEEYSRLVDVPNIQNPNGLRDKALLEVLFSTGMRVSELIALNVGQINFLRGEIAVLGKGKKLRVVFLSDEAKELLIKYLVGRGVLENEETTRPHTVPNTEGHLKDEADMTRSHTVDITEETKDATMRPILNSKFLILNSAENEPLFLSSRGSRMNARGIERMISKYAKIAGITKQVTPHTLRHTFATDMLSAGADIRSVQSLLGHSNISTTQVYTHVTDQHLREIHQRFHGVKEEGTTRPPTDNTTEEQKKDKAGTTRSRNSHSEENDDLSSLRGTKQSNE